MKSRKQSHQLDTTLLELVSANRSQQSPFQVKWNMHVVFRHVDAKYRIRTILSRSLIDETAVVTNLIRADQREIKIRHVEGLVEETEDSLSSLVAIVGRYSIHDSNFSLQ
mmetsp:Transcript_37334/g.52707  ORF Transcript_37334/g.52707 Transcript_37334/m.52707 type:complete len:110 (-) Transcript_37334:577-906(-)